MTGHIFETYKHDFERDGFVMMQDALTAQQVQDMNAQLREWVDESRNYKKNYGRIADGRPRFDVEPTSHSPETPALRRITHLCRTIPELKPTMAPKKMNSVGCSNPMHSAQKHEFANKSRLLNGRHHSNQCHCMKSNQSTCDGIKAGLQAHRESQIL